MDINLTSPNGIKLNTQGKYCSQDITVKPKLESVELTPSQGEQNVTPDEGYAGFGAVKVNAIPSDYVIPSGTQQITENGTYDVTNKATAVVNVASSGGAELNVEVGHTPPTDTTKLWLDIDANSEVVFTAIENQRENVITHKGQMTISAKNLIAVPTDEGIWIFDETNSQYYLYYNNQFWEFGTYDYQGGSYVSVNDKCYRVGGSESDVYSNKIELLSSSMFGEQGTFYGSYKDVITAAVGNIIYIFGGRDGGGAKTTSVGMFAINDNNEGGVYQSLPVTLPEVLCKAKAAAIGTKIYIFGGQGSYDDDHPWGNIKNKIYEFDTVTQTFTTLSVTLPEYFNDFQVTAFNDRIYIFGGATFEYVAINLIYVFDGKTKTIYSIGTLPINMYGVAQCFSSPYIYLFGGHFFNYGSGDKDVSDIYTFEPYFDPADFNEQAATCMVNMSNIKNEFNLSNSPKIKCGAYAAYRGDYDSVSYRVNAYLFKNNKWTEIMDGHTLTSPVTQLSTPTIAVESGTTISISGYSDSTTRFDVYVNDQYLSSFSLSEAINGQFDLHNLYNWDLLGDNDYSIKIKAASQTNSESNFSNSVTITNTTISKAWSLNSTINWVSSQIYYAPYRLASEQQLYSKIQFTVTALTLANAIAYNGNWINSKYQSIIFVNPPRGELLTWLKANGTPQ